MLTGKTSRAGPHFSTVTPILNTAAETDYRGWVKSLEMPDAHHLSSALGWLGLGNWHEAEGELEMIAPSLRAHPDVQRVRWEICAKAGKWDVAAGIAAALRDADPQDTQSWINSAYATRRMQGGGLNCAKEILTKARKLFPKEPIVVYNLACYECQLGDLKGALKLLEKAFAIGDSESLKRMALGDADLKPLWAEIIKL